MSTVTLEENIVINGGLIRMVKQLYLGQTLTVIDTNGQPLAVLVGLQRKPSPHPFPTIGKLVGKIWRSELADPGIRNKVPWKY